MYIVLFGILLMALVFAADPTWDEAAYNVSHYFNEDSIQYYNFTDNLTDVSQLQHLSILDILWSENSSKSLHTDFPWLPWNDSGFANSTTGVMKLNSTKNNETGNFTINVFAQGLITGQSTKFSFIINATNDAPEITNLIMEYNLTQDQNFLDYINATDEEEHYGLFFDISFFDNCSLASWSTRANCSLFSLTNVSDTSAIMNFTPGKNDVGVYSANITVRDRGEDYSCPHAYCDNSIYEQNQSYVLANIAFNVFSALEINASDCENKIFQENESGACEINIITKGGNDVLNISDVGSIRNYAGSVSNTSWFYPNNQTNATDFIVTAYVNVTPQKTEIGNWTINFTVKDINSNETVSELIYVSVNRTSNDVPELVDIENLNTSVELSTIINLIVYDDDLLVPDKLEGYNETTTFNVTILNQSDLSQELTISGFDVEVLNMPVSGTNRTEAKIEFNSSEAGNYTINITINDEDNIIDSDLFNLSIISNEYPVWNQTEYFFDLVVNSSLATTESFGPINLTGDNYISDTAGDVLTFVNDSSAMPSFNLSSGGMIAFTPYKQDVGSWNFSVTATDSLGLENKTTFRFTITNTNSEPVIETPISLVNATYSVSPNVVAQEDNYTTFTLWIQDEDFRIDSDRRYYYNESLDINVEIQGNNSNLFSFLIDSDFPEAGNNKSKYIATFIPNNTDIGEYNITINVTDASNSSDVLVFNLTINEVNDAPVLTDLVNQTSAVNRIFYYDINASDEEDGDDTQGNLVFDYSFISGEDIFNSTIFNTTSGEINITFNSSQGGKYQINITVNDSSNSKDSQMFWIYVYDVPNVTYPYSGENFSLQENVTSNLTFSGNHSIQNNLTYEFYINNTLRYNITYYGNETNLTWEFTPNFTDETDGDFQNLTLVVYASDTELENKTDLNQTIDWNVNISHTNAPVVFSGNIADKQSNYDQDITINLSQYFSDVDYDDVDYNQTINFTITSNSSSSYISSSISSDWILTLSSLIAVTEIINITGDDSSTNATSNNFEVQFTIPSTVTVPTPSGGSSATIPVSLKIIMPDPASAYIGDSIILPITLYNDGKRTLSGIDLTSIIVKDGLIRDDITVSFDKYYLDNLGVEEKENITMTIDVNTDEKGTFEITINASVKSPKYVDWGKMYLTIKETNESLLEKLIFTQEFLEENPECIELEEILDEAREFFAKGDFVNTVIKIQESINGCKNAISQQARLKRSEEVEDKLYRYLFIAAIVAFFIGIVYYSYRRIKLRKSSETYFSNQKNIFNVVNKEKTLMFITIGAIGFLFVLIKGNITGFAISDISLNQNKFIFIFIMGVLGFLIFLKRNKLVKFAEIIKRRIKKIKSKNNISDLIKKKVYTSSGDYIGRVDEVILDKNKINSLKIKIDKNVMHRSVYPELWSKGAKKVNGIKVSYKYVESVGQHIVIIKKGLKEKIK